MNQTVTIKGTKSGIILVLDSVTDFPELKVDIGNKFQEASAFLGKNKMGLIIRGRELTDDQQNEVVKIIESNSELSITCIVDEESMAERLFSIQKNADKSQEAPVNSLAPSDSEVIEDFAKNYDNSALIYTGNLRSGQDISCEQSVVVLGDVKPGASVTSYGSIFILGELRGNAFAGAGGDRRAIVMALDLNPLQVRIADAIAISPDAEKGPKLRFKKKKIIANENEPEVAYIENGHIIKTLYGASFLRQYNK